MDDSSAIDYLIRSQHVTGGWGYKTGHRPVVEPTAVTLLAIRDESIAQDAFQRGSHWLLSCQHEDGGWGINKDDPESGWQTAWSLIILKAASQDPGAISRGENWLTKVATYELSTKALQRSQFPANLSIGGLAWPWFPGQAAWLEPTALALLALHGVSMSALAGIRQKSALDYLLHNRTPAGGWWVGNAGPLDTVVIPRAYQTALVLITLATLEKSAIQAEDLAALQKDLANEPGMLAHSIGRFALHMLGVGTEIEDSILASHQLPDGSWEENPFVTAWALLGSKGAW